MSLKVPPFGTLSYKVLDRKGIFMVVDIKTLEQIGKVLFKQIQIDSQINKVYSDGPVEKELYYGFKDDPHFGDIDNGYRFASWAHEYHLSPVRHNLLSWFPFDPNSTVLEIGAGCGALTGLLCRKLKNVTALEYSRQRALVTAQRHSMNLNLEVIVGGFQNFETEKRFDYITIIGVLEYARKFYGGENPYESFLSQSRKLLKPDGTLILAIENKIGSKYITGAPEDHTGRVFDSIYDYPFSNEVRTFCKKELTDLLHSAGFHNQVWYYPIPDYKMPKVILSDESVPKDLDSLWRLYPAEIGNVPRKEVFSERRFAKTITRAGLFGELANSFLVISRSRNTSETKKCLRFEGADLGRKVEFRTNTRILKQGCKRVFVKSADNKQAMPFLQGFVERETLAKEFFHGHAEVVSARLEGSSLYYPYLEFFTLEELIAKDIESGSSDFGKPLLEKYIQFVRNLPSQSCIPKKFMEEYEIPSHEIPEPVPCLTRAPIDCIARNILVDENKWHIIDLEWMLDFAIPTDILFFRGIYSLIIDLQSQIQAAVSEKRPVVLFSGHRDPHYVPLSWLDLIENIEIPLKQLAGWNIRFQNRATINQFSRSSVRYKSKSRVFNHVNINEIKNESESLYRFRRFLWKIKNRYSYRKMQRKYQNANLDSR